MSIKPILFNTDMVRAILDRRKTVTRRVLAEKAVLDKKWGLDREPYLHNGKWYYDEQTAVDDSRTIELKPKYQPGDILYVRETWCEGKIDQEDLPDGFNGECYVSQCAGDTNHIHKEYCIRNNICIDEVTWRPSIHMPKEAARIWLKVTNVRVERLWDITLDQCVKEGLIDSRGFIHSLGNEYDELRSPKLKFQALWDSTVNKAELDHCGWEANPWVWVIEFEQCDKPQEGNS